MGLTVLASVYTYVDEEECSNPFNLIVVCSKSFFSTLVSILHRSNRDRSLREIVVTLQNAIAISFLRNVSL